MLEPYRVLDLTDARGYFCGKILADVGADVLKVDRPAGGPQQSSGPAGQSDLHPDTDLPWLAYNANKRGISLDLEHETGRRLFCQLARSADVVVESFPPGYLASLELDYDRLAAINPKLIVASITGFGQRGPYANYRAPDLVVAAMSGQMHHTGEADGPPLRMSVPQAYLNACTDAALAILIALWHRRRSGLGQHIDAAAQRSMLWFAAYGIPHWQMQHQLLGRVGQRRAGLQRGKLVRQLWPCKDGFVCFTLIGGQSGARSNRPLTQWMEEAGFADDFLRGLDWDAFDMATCSPELADVIEGQIAKFFLAHSIEDLYLGATTRRIMLYPVASPRELVDDAQLQAREFWSDVEHPESGSEVRYPGSFVKSTAVSLAMRRRAPMLGEHNREVYRELGIDEEHLATLREDGVI
ncbi:MAG: CaiB/BaiF CoA-transferase family protein [Dehalococcoidia bacterium]